MSEEIKGMINPEYWQKCVDGNDDSYSKACVNVARNVMKHLDDYEGDFNIGYKPDMTTAHGIMCECDDQGITGFQAGCVTNMVVLCHEKGWKFYLSFHISSYDVDEEENLQKMIDNLANADLTVSREEAEKYMRDMVQRFKDKAA